MSRKNVLWTIFLAAIVVLFGVGVFFLGRSSRESAESATQGPPGYSLGPGGFGMVGGGTDYVQNFSAVESVPTEQLIAEIREYLDQQGNSDLALASLREFTFAYQAEVIERSTGRHAFGLMVGKAQARISPKAGPNVFWNTRYGPRVAEVGGGYGMLGRLLPEGPVDETAVSATEARSIAEEAVDGLDADFDLTDDTATFYGFYEFYVRSGEELIGELDVNAYSGQVWYKDWGEPQISFQSLISDE